MPTLNQLLILGAIVGLVLGLIPLILGFTKKNLKLGLIGFLLTILGGTLFSFLGAIPLSAVFSWLVLRNKPDAPATDATQTNAEPSGNDSENA